MLPLRLYNIDCSGRRYRNHNPKHIETDVQITEICFETKTVRLQEAVAHAESTKKTSGYKQYKHNIMKKRNMIDDIIIPCCYC